MFTKQTHNNKNPLEPFSLSYLLDTVEKHMTEGKKRKGKTEVLILSLYLNLPKGFNLWLPQGGSQQIEG